MAQLMDGQLRATWQQSLGLSPWLFSVTCTLLACGGAEQNDQPAAGGAMSEGGANAQGGMSGGSLVIGGQTSSSLGGKSTALAGGTGNTTGGTSTSRATGGSTNTGTGGLVFGGTTGTSTARGGQSTGGTTSAGQSAGGQTSGGIAGSKAAAGTTGVALGGVAGTSIGIGGKPSAGQAGMQAAGGKATGGTTSSSNCGIASQTKSSRAARSAGFTGTYQDNYAPLQTTDCTTNTKCQTACVQAGGNTTSCASSECITSTPNYCLPPTFWFDLDRLRIESGTVEDSAWITMVNNPYRDQLIVSDFQFEIPATAIIQGIAFSILRSADSTNIVADFEVKVMRGTTTIGLDRAKTTAWPATFAYAEYGSTSDLWGTTWTPANINATNFGLALTPMYLDTGGNARGYVDFVRATVTYAVPCT